MYYQPILDLHSGAVHSLEAHREGDDGATLTKAIIALGRDLDLQTVAEGIEDAEEHGWMRSLGCEFGQGFHFARPMAGDEVTEFLTRGS